VHGEAFHPAKQFAERTLKATKNTPQKQKTGPKEQRLKLKGDWEALVGKALAKKRPKKGWPKG
jgi:hypothetical protein